MATKKKATKKKTTAKAANSRRKHPCDCRGFFQEGAYVHAESCTRPRESDRDVTKALEAGPASNRELRERMGVPTDKVDPKLDRKLQQMRKKGELKIVGKRWALRTTEECPTCKGRGWVKARSAS